MGFTPSYSPPPGRSWGQKLVSCGGAVEESWRSRGGVVEELCIFDGCRGHLERSGRDFWRLQSALDAIFRVLGAPRGTLERSGRDFWRLKSAQDAMLGVLGAPRGSLEASGYNFSAFWTLRGLKNVAFWCSPRGQRPGGWGIASLIIHCEMHFQYPRFV